ncbi:Homocysteine S-methyltransferase [Xylariaceae sp. FL0594]|nr:Homocysteine S-methyltransferase [Xylariaceae sp. FL0594]
MTATSIQFLDGGLGTSLEDEYGFHFSETTPLWSSHLLLSDRDILTSCQRAFAEIPVDVLLTATYQMSAEGFGRTRTDFYPAGVPREEIGDFLDAAVSILEEVKQPETKIALSLGPYGAVMVPSQEYSGQYDDEHDSTDKLFRWHIDRISLFYAIPNLERRVNYLAFETVPRLDEILAIRQVASLLSSQSQDAATASPLGRTPFWISCVFPGADHTLPDGSSIDQVIQALLSAEHSGSIPWGIGINCTKIAHLSDLVAAFEKSVRDLQERGQLASWPSLLLYPDGTNGEVYDTTTKSWRLPISPAKETSWEEQLADIVSQAQSRGCWQSIIAGGCCKATHADIARLRSHVISKERKKAA